MLTERMRIWLRRSIFGIICGFGGALVTLLIALIVFLGSRPDLSVWHTARLDEEFTAESKVDSFEEYIELKIDYSISSTNESMTELRSEMKQVSSGQPDRPRRAIDELESKFRVSE